MTMTRRQIEVVLGALHHDDGKVIFRSGNRRIKHSQSGCEYLEKHLEITDPVILDCVRYHHFEEMKAAKLEEDSPAYIVYLADNIAAAMDRREWILEENGEPEEAVPDQSVKSRRTDNGFGFTHDTPLKSVFNLLNGNQGKLHYGKQFLEIDGEIGYPDDQPVKLDSVYYKEIADKLEEHLKGIPLTEDYLNSVLEVLEIYMSYVPSSTANKEQADISLYDHVKITAAISSCIEQYLVSNNRMNWKKELFTQEKKRYEEKMFLLYSMDISGIQNFIYAVGSQGNLKGLRARSFYLELLMEHIVDELLQAVSCSRANLIYTGGGHCNMLLPNTKEVRQIIAEKEAQINEWFMRQFGIDLYISGGYAVCSAYDLQNKPSGSYAALYREISRKISEKKSHRYSAQQILWLNRQHQQGERECAICRRVAKLNPWKEEEIQICPTCEGLLQLARDILKKDYFVVVNHPAKEDEYQLRLPGDKYLVAEDEDGLNYMMESERYVRCYSKNRHCIGKRIASKLWVGAYASEESVTFEKLAQAAEGIERIAILRADVDNLGHAIAHGFERKDMGEQKQHFVTLSRTATLSRQLSLFFKGYVNWILENGRCDVLKEKDHKIHAELKPGGSNYRRNMVIVYSGGDDVFFAGSWDDVIEAYVDLKKAFAQFTQGTLTISGGIGIYQSGYPINMMAKEVADLEGMSKNLDGKNAITLFDEHGVYNWDEFINEVIDDKFVKVAAFFDNSEARGKAFLYRLLDLVREISGYEKGKPTDRINLARVAYVLSRLEPDREEAPEQYEAYRRFAKDMYQWVNEEKIDGEIISCKQLITAMYLYVYRSRKRENQDGE